MNNWTVLTGVYPIMSGVQPVMASVFFSVLSQKYSRERKTIFGSEARLAEIADNSRRICLERWGDQKHFAVYFGRIADLDTLAACMDTILKAARLGHCFTLFLHNKQQKTFLRTGWNILHTSIDIRTVSACFLSVIEETIRDDP